MVHLEGEKEKVVSRGRKVTSSASGTRVGEDGIGGESETRDPSTPDSCLPSSLPSAHPADMPVVRDEKQTDPKGRGRRHSLELTKEIRERTLF